MALLCMVGRSSVRCRGFEGRVQTLFLQHGTATCQLKGSLTPLLQDGGCAQLQTLFWPSLLLGPYLQTRGPLTAGALDAAVGGPGLYLPLYHPADSTALGQYAA